MAVDYTTQTSGGIGDAVLRKEDRKFVTGESRYTDDLKLPGMLHACFVRSPFGHARITSIDISAALALDPLQLGGDTAAFFVAELRFDPDTGRQERAGTLMQGETTVGLRGPAGTLRPDIDELSHHDERCSGLPGRFEDLRDLHALPGATGRRRSAGPDRTDQQGIRRLSAPWRYRSEKPHGALRRRTHWRRHMAPFAGTRCGRGAGLPRTRGAHTAAHPGSGSGDRR